MSFFSSLPELLERKRLVDMHTNVATAVLEQIKVIDMLRQSRTFSVHATVINFWLLG